MTTDTDMDTETPTIDTGNEHLRIEAADDRYVVTATIDRPEARNALSSQVTNGLQETIRAIEDTDVRVFVIRGSDGMFCSGGDLDAMTDIEGAMDYRDHFSTLARIAGDLATLDALVVAGVEGYCLAGGLGLASACDLVLAADDATFGTPEVNVGLFPMQAMAPITRTVGEKKALKLMFTGEHIDAATADSMGLVSEVVSASEFEERLAELVATLTNVSPVAIEMGKRAYYAQREMDYDRALEYLREMIALMAMSEDTKEGLRAFQEDREPEWSGQ
jgi:enoyl-CoA hydratase/carnithine racemase